jgi:hypothetical protein
VVGILVMGLGFLYLSRKYFRKKVSTRLAFFLSGTIISFSMLLLASALSLKYHTIEYKGSISSWTYVFENRPFIFSIILLQLILVVFILSKKQVPGFLSLLGKLATLLMALSFIHGVYYLVKTSLSPASAKPESLSINELVLRDEDSLKVKYHGYHTWIATELQHLDWYAKLHGRIILNNLTYLNDSSFSLPARTILISVIPKEDTGKIKTYLERKKIDSAWNYDQTWFLYLQKRD